MILYKNACRWADRCLLLLLNLLVRLGNFSSCEREDEGEQLTNLLSAEVTHGYYSAVVPRTFPLPNQPAESRFKVQDINNMTFEIKGKYDSRGSFSTGVRLSKRRRTLQSSIRRSRIHIVTTVIIMSHQLRRGAGTTLPTTLYDKIWLAGLLLSTGLPAF